MKSSRIGQIGVPAAIVCIVVMMVVPLPTALLDLLLAVNITASMLILLVTMYVRRALDFSTFPSLLLIATLFRLALNVSSTRLILLHGYAGQVIESFGRFVIGGSLIVGLVVFVILIIIQFVVITNGSGRVAEVAARFTLDAMPGKQMAIDADLNAGILTDEEARKRREEVASEADFYGAMDGASKFVKGDAIAAIIIVLVNLFGGFAVGVLQNKLSLGEAVSTYSLLSVGEGLVSQIPALLISIATGLIVTRVASEEDMGSGMLEQFGRQTRALQVAGGAVSAMALIPGLPKLPFLLVGIPLLFVARRAARAPVADPDEGETEEHDAPAPDSAEALVGEMRVEPLELHISYDLLDLVDRTRGGDLLDRVKALRRKTAADLGVVIPPVRTRDNLDLAPGVYAIRVHGVEVARGEAPPGMVLVLGGDLASLPGTPSRDPVFGLEALWLPVEMQAQVEMGGATVVDRASVITTHLSEVVHHHAGKLLSRQDVKKLVDLIRETDPIVVEELTPAQLTLGEIQAVLCTLLDEGVCVRDLVRVFETISERARISKDVDSLVEAARVALGPAISHSLADGVTLRVITIDPLVEHAFLEGLRHDEEGGLLAVDPTRTEAFMREAFAILQNAQQQGFHPVLVCSAPLRSALRRLLAPAVPQLPVLSYPELGGQLEIETVGVISLADAAAL